jgi:hypothetical protein
LNGPVGAITINRNEHGIEMPEAARTAVLRWVGDRSSEHRTTRIVLEHSGSFVGITGVKAVDATKPAMVQPVD